VALAKSRRLTQWFLRSALCGCACSKEGHGTMHEPFDCNAEGRELIRSVLVVGASAAGWLTASYLKKAFPGLELTLLDAADVAEVCPAQGTNADFQSRFFDVLGVSEDDWMRECAASFKVATKYANWSTPRSETPDDYYYRLYEPIPDCDNLSLSHYWLLNRLRGDRQPMEYACHEQPKVLDVKLAPRYRDGSRAMHYGWHVDGQRLSSFLKRQAAAWGVRRINERLGHVELAPDGSIRSVTTAQGRKLEADLFVDCSGARRLLLGRALREPFVDMQDFLVCDSVVTSTFENDDAADGVEPYTSAIALNAGWAWKLPMLGRSLTGYVYSSRFSAADEVARELCALWELDEGRQSLTEARLEVGRSRRAWVKNCVSIGSAWGTLEPLEASSLDFVCAALQELAKHFPDKSFGHVLRDRFNLALETLFDGARDLTQLHYLASPRVDSSFWRTSRRDLKLSPNAQRALETHGLGVPAGYHVLAGMGLVPERPLPFVRYRPDSQEKARQIFEGIRQRSDQLYAQLPTNYELLHQLHDRKLGA
jgi:hypothetical protein